MRTSSEYITPTNVTNAAHAERKAGAQSRDIKAISISKRNHKQNHTFCLQSELYTGVCTNRHLALPGLLALPATGGVLEGGTRTWVCPGALITLPVGSCRQDKMLCTHSSANTSSSVARSLVLTRSMRLMMYLLSRGRRRRRRHGPLITSGRGPPDCDDDPGGSGGASLLVVRVFWSLLSLLLLSLLVDFVCVAFSGCRFSSLGVDSDLA